jgi:hypothetical protein
MGCVWRRTFQPVISSTISLMQAPLDQQADALHAARVDSERDYSDELTGKLTTKGSAPD